MKVLLQRVRQASVKVEGQATSSIDNGLLLLVGIGADDTQKNLEAVAAKICHMRIFPDENGRFDLSVLDIDGEILAVPQFTLYADTRKGRRPEFFGAMKPPEASEYFDSFVNALNNLEVKKVETGVFGAHMVVSLENDGPVTILVEN